MPWHPETFIFWVKKLNGTFIVAEHENDLIGFCGIGFTKKGAIYF
ncbi:Protein of unknown function [Bacillus wiedmannii]|nr:Protein of unknown function [Bacillus wiedmannii]